MVSFLLNLYRDMVDEILPFCGADADASLYIPDFRENCIDSNSLRPLYNVNKQQKLQQQKSMVFELKFKKMIEKNR